MYEFDGTTGAPIGNFTAPGTVIRLTQYNGNTYLLNQANGSVYEYNSSGNFVGTFIKGTQSAFDAGDIAFGPDGDLYMTLADSNEVVRYSSTGAYLGIFGNGPTNPTHSGIHSLLGLAFRNDGNLYVADFQGEQIVVYGPGGGDPISMSSVGGQLDDITFNSSGAYYYSLSSTDGIYAQSDAQFSSCPRFGSARSLAFETDGNLYFACQDSGTIDRVDGTNGGDATVFASGGGLENALDFAFLPYTPEPPTAAVPEVSTATLGSIGLAAVAAMQLFRKRKTGIA